MSLRLAPAGDLNACYLIGGKTYSKGDAQSTVSALDYALLYLELQNRIPFLGKLTASIDAFLA